MCANERKRESEHYRTRTQVKKNNKYNNQKTTINGCFF